MITPAFSLTATERVLPRLALDFTTASLDPRVTFTRTGNTATVTNSSGNVVGINANLPRFDYDPITLACKGLLIEEARTNALTYSEQFDNAAWGKSEVTVTANSVISPSGTLTADTLQNNTNIGSHGIFTAIVFATGSTMTVYAKAGTTNFVGITNTSNFAAYSGATFNLSTGQVGVTANCTASMIDVGNGWYRCVVANTTTYAGSFFVVSVLESNQAPWLGYAGTNKNIYIWGAQLETGPFPSSYIPTVASTVLRNADVASMTGTNFSDWYNTSQSTVVAEYFYPLNANPGSAVFSFGPVALGSFLSINLGNVGWFNGSLNPNATSNAINKIALAFNGTGNASASANSGSVVSSSTVDFTTTTTSVNIGSRVGGSSFCNTWVRKIFYYKQFLTNNELRSFSK